jgi:hypothetical protein
MIKELILNIKKTIDDWHSNNLKNFEIEKNFDENNPSCLIKKLAYHNYCGWHLIEEYQNSNKNTIQFVYDGGLIHNKDRNNCMEMIDEFFYKLQKNEGNFNSEGFGSIFDRLINDYIKYLHLKQSNDIRSDSFYEQINFLETALEQLYKEVLVGSRKITIFKKFKSSGY